MPLKYTVHIVAPAEYSQMKAAIEKISLVNGEEASVCVTGWEYSFSTLAHWAASVKNSDPDIVLMFDTAEYPKVNEKTGGKLYHTGMVTCIREARLRLKSKFVLVLSSDKESNLELLNELMKINIHNFFFAPDQFSVDDLKTWMFTPDRTLKDNEKYLVAGDGIARTKVIRDDKHPSDTEKIRIKEKVVTVEKVVKEKVTVSFKKLVLSIWGSAEFACELAYIAARLTRYKVLLVDLNFIAPKMDIYLNLHNPDDSGQHTGFLPIFETLQQNPAGSEKFESACLKHINAENLYILFNSTDVEIGTELADNCISALIESAYRFFDITILIPDRSLQNPVTATCLTRSDYNIWAVQANMDTLKESGAWLDYINSKLNIPLDKNMLVAYEYKKNINYPIKYLKDIYYPNCFLGTVSYSEEREYYRNLNQCYAKRLADEYPEEYIRILSKFNIVPAKSTVERFGDLIRSMVSKSRLLKRQKQEILQKEINHQSNETEGNAHEQKDCV